MDFRLQRTAMGFRGGLQLLQNVVVEIPDQQIRHCKRTTREWYHNDTIRRPLFALWVRKKSARDIFPAESNAGPIVSRLNASSLVAYDCRDSKPISSSAKTRLRPNR